MHNQRHSSFCILHSAFCIVLALALASARTAAGENVVTPRYYVGESLVAMYDAVYNATNAAGAWVHDAAATNWLDYSGNGHHFALNDGDAVFADHVSFIRGSHVAANPLFSAYTRVTFECNVRPTAADAAGKWASAVVGIPYIGGFNWDGRGGAIGVNRPQTESGTTYNYRNYNSGYSMIADIVSAGVYQTYSASPSIGTTTTSLNDPVYVNGAQVSANTGALNWNGGTRSSSLLLSVGGSKVAADFRSVRVYGRQLTADEIAHNALIDRIRFEGETPPAAIAPSISLSQVANAAVAGEALLALEVDDFGWLASSLTSCAVEYASTSDFASSSSVAAILYDGVTGAARISSLTPGATYYARAVATNDLGTDSVGEAIAFVAQETATAAPVLQNVSIALDTAISATLSATVAYAPGGACDLYAVVTRDGETYTNLLARAVAQNTSGAYLLRALTPGTALTVRLLAVSGEAVAESAPLPLSIPVQALSPAAYAQGGLIVLLDAIFNAKNALGKPYHDPDAENWTDLTGNYTFVSGGTADSPLTFTDTAAVFPAVSRYLTASSAPEVSDAVLAGTFTVEAAAKVQSVSSTRDICYALYSIGSGSSTKPRTLCFDLRNSGSSKIGCIQYNADSFKEAARLAAYSGNNFTIPATLTVIGGGAAGTNAKFYHSGNYIQAVSNTKSYTTASSITKALRLRYYDSSAITTHYNAFRFYNRVLSADEIALNNEIDAVRFRGATPPSAIEPSFSLSCIDSGVSGAVTVSWGLASFGWPSTNLASIVMEYSASPDFADATTVTLAQNTTEGGSMELSGLVPGATYYVRAVAENGIGIAAVVEPFSFRASSGLTNDPVFTVGPVSPSVGSASFDFSLVRDGGGLCDGYVILSRSGSVLTNAFATGVASPYAATVPLAPLAPDTAYTATVVVTNAVGGAGEPVVRAFTTLRDETFVNPYVTDGLIGHFDGILNAVDERGVPFHDMAPATWADLKGNFPLTKSSTGVISFTSNTVSFSQASYAQCSSAALACNAILAGKFTVETLVRFSSRATSNEDMWGIYSFGSGSSGNPRILCFDTRYSAGLYGAIQYNDTAWTDGAMQLHDLNFTKAATYSIVGGGTCFDPASLFVNAVWTNSLPNRRANSPTSTSTKRFSIHQYDPSNNGQAYYNSFRIYDRPLSNDELAANRLADEVRFSGRQASLDVVSFHVAGGVLSATLERSAGDFAAPVNLFTAAEYGDETEMASGQAFAAGESRLTVVIALPPGTAYVRFKAGGLVSPLIFVYGEPEPDTAVIAQRAAATGPSHAEIDVAVSIPSGTPPLSLHVAYGLEPGELIWTNDLAGAESVAESGGVTGILSGLVPVRTYYYRVFATDGARTFWAPDDGANFTTSASEDASTPVVTVTGTNYVDGNIASLTVEVATSHPRGLLLFGDIADRGFASDDWAYSNKVADVPAGGGVFTVPMPQGWGDTILAVRLAAGVATPLESVHKDGSYVDTGLPVVGAMRFDIDTALDTTTTQQRILHAGSETAGTIYYSLYVNSNRKWAYSWNVTNGKWNELSIAADTERHVFSLDGSTRTWRIDARQGTMVYSGTAPYTAPATTALRLLGSGSNTAAGTFYSAQAYGPDGMTLVGDYIPAETGDGACFYDRVTHRALFLVSGDMTAGAPVAGRGQLADATPAFLYQDATLPTLDPEVTVTGHETGDTLTFTGRVSNASRVTVNGHEATLAQDGMWTVTITDGIEPGVPYECRVLAWAGGAMDALPVFTETTRAASRPYWKTTIARTQRALTVSGRLDVHGANDTTVRLLTGPSPDALTNTLVLVKAPDDDPAFSFLWNAPFFDEEIFCAFSTENAATDPANGHWTVTNEYASVTTYDNAIYTWQDVAGDWTGDWSDTAHWADDKGGDAIGLPCTATATALIPQGTVNVDTNVTVKTVAFGNDGPVTLTGAEGAILGTAASGSPYNVIPNGAEVLVTGDLTFTSSEAFDICGGTPASAAYAASFTVAGGATFSAGSLELARDGVFRVRDATASIGNIYFNHASNGDGGSTFASYGGGVVLEGVSPRLTVRGDLRSYNKTGTGGGGYVEFRVPRAGYAQTPLVMTGTSSGQTFCGDKKVATNSREVEVRIAADSLLYAAGGTVDFELATWAKKHTDGAALVSLNPLRGADHNPRRRLYITDDDLSLRVQFNGGFTVIMLR